MTGYKDPEKDREYNRRWRAANPERTRELGRLYRERNREGIRARARERYRNNAQARQAIQESNRAWALAHADHLREYKHQRKLAGYKSPQDRQRDEIAAKLWHEQDGRCYLCTEPVILQDAHVEHDHRCCPKGSFCCYCVRGLSCPGCNYAVGHAYDDPDRLELIARNLRAKLAEMDNRLAAKPEQLELEAP